MFQRPHKQILTKRLTESRNFIQIIYGPRQIGKTTMVVQCLDDLKIPVHYAVADAVTAADIPWIEYHWETARIKLKNSGRQELVLAIDEIQKVSGWSEIVKRKWDEDTMTNTNIKVVLLGSSRLLLQQGMTESLAGRLETLYMGHWSFPEMHEAFGMDEDQFVWFGGYPGSIPLIDDEPRWKQYIRDSLIETSISKDILMLTRVDKPVLMRKLFELGCLYSGQILSLNKILGQLHDAGNTTTLSNYLGLLDSAGLLTGIEKFSPDVLRQRKSSPKFQVQNTALISAQSAESFISIMEKTYIWGRWVESAVGAHLLTHSISRNFSVFYWRNANDEVDYIISRGDKYIGLEVKSGSKQKGAGMVAFQKRYSPIKTILIGKDGIDWKEFLRIDPAELF